MSRRESRLKGLRIKEELKIVDDQISSPSYAVDLAKAILDLIATKEYGIYHLSNTSYCSRYKWADCILNQTGWKGKLLPVKSNEFLTAARRPLFSVLDNYPLKELLDYELPGWTDATLRYLTRLSKDG